MDNLHRRGSEFNLPRLKEAGIEFHRGDVRKLEEFPAGPFDFLVECSAEPSVLAGRDGSPDYLFETNLTGAYRCLEKARHWKSRVLFLSTSRVYPVARLEMHPFKEDAMRFSWEDHGTPGITSRGVSEAVDMAGARSLYGFTKLAAEQLIEEYREGFGVKAIVNRCGVIAGPWQFGKVDQGVAAHWVLAHIFDKPLSYIGYGGSGKQVRDFLHVDDLCDLLVQQIAAFDQWDGWVGNVSLADWRTPSRCVSYPPFAGSHWQEISGGINRGKPPLGFANFYWRFLSIVLPHPVEAAEGRPSYCLGHCDLGKRAARGFGTTLIP